MENTVQTAASEVSPTPPASPEPVEGSYYGKRNWKKLILIYLVIGAIIYAGIYYFVLSKQSTNPYSTNYPTPTVTQTATVDETANWKTYTSTNGYSIKYPSDASFNTATSNDSIEFEIKNNTLDLTFWKPVTILSNQTVDRFLNPGGLGPEPNMQKVQGSILDGSSVFRYEGTMNGEPFIHIGVPLKDNKILEIRAYYSNTNDKDLSILKSSLDKILATFKFTQ